MDGLINCWVGQKFQLGVDDRLKIVAYIEFRQTHTAIELQDLSLLYTGSWKEAVERSLPQASPIPF
jgi:hypothetical protein